MTPILCGHNGCDGELPVTFSTTRGDPGGGTHRDGWWPPTAGEWEVAESVTCHLCGHRHTADALADREDVAEAGARAVDEAEEQRYDRD